MVRIATTKMSSKGQIVIPQEMRKDFKKGDQLLVIQNNHEIILKKEIPQTALLSEKSLSEDWLSPEDEEAWKDL